MYCKLVNLHCSSQLIILCKCHPRHKNKVRLDEIRTLLQGSNVPNPPICSKEPLRPHNERPKSPPMHNHPPLIMEEPADTVGQSQITSKSTVTASPSSDQEAIPSTSRLTEANIFRPGHCDPD